MAIASKTFSVTKYEKGSYTVGNTTKDDIITTIYWRISYTDDSSTPQTVHVEGSSSFDPFHLITGGPDPKTGAVNNSFIEFSNLTDANLASWFETEYNRDAATKQFCDYKANYLLTGSDPDNKFTIGFSREE